jgi:hydroxypyruvate reductase
VTHSIDRLRADALAIYRAALSGADPEEALRAALPLSPSGPLWIIAIGKAAVPMARAALIEAGDVRGGLVVAPEPGPTPHRRLERTTGDHPLPGDGSERAAAALGDTLAQVRKGEEIWVLLSGGATSLLGSPIPGITSEDYRAYLALLGTAGLAIDELNRLRKRVSRWGAGRLAAAADPGATIRVFAVSDVPGDDLAAIGSGPCAPDPTTATEIRSILETHGLLGKTPGTVRATLDQVIAGTAPETAKPGDPIFRRVSSRIITSNAMALDRAAIAAEEHGYLVRRLEGVFQGEAAAQGAMIASALVEAPRPGPLALLAGGETTVALGSAFGLGGRCQELALAAAQVLVASAGPAAVLAAGTDGRDGPTDAAGALVDDSTWLRIAAAGIDPAEALRRHDAYPALDAATALIRTGPTGTNVMDVVVGLAGLERH